MAEHYTDEDVQAAVRILQQPRMHTNMSGDKHRADMRAVLDAVAPAIAARAKAEALRALIRHCFDENDAGAVVGGIETVEVYVFDTIAQLTGEAKDAEAAAKVRQYARKSLAQKLGRADEIEGRPDMCGKGPCSDVAGHEGQCVL